MERIRLTMAQALVRFLENQYVAWDDVEQPFVRGVFMLPGHGNVVGLGQALPGAAHNFTAVRQFLYLLHHSGDSRPLIRIQLPLSTAVLSAVTGADLFAGMEFSFMPAL